MGKNLLKICLAASLLSFSRCGGVLNNTNLVEGSVEGLIFTGNPVGAAYGAGIGIMLPKRELHFGDIEESDLDYFLFGGKIGETYH